MAKPEDQIKQEITDYITQNGGGYRAWYTGVAADPRERVFTQHGVRENGDAWIYEQATSSKSARNLEEHFLAPGADGGAGGGDASTDHVYAYKKAAHTNP